MTAITLSPLDQNKMIPNGSFDVKSIHVCNFVFFKVFQILQSQISIHIIVSCKQLYQWRPNRASSLSFQHKTSTWNMLINTAVPVCGTVIFVLISRFPHQVLRWRDFKGVLVFSVDMVNNLIRWRHYMSYSDNNLDQKDINCHDVCSVWQLTKCYSCVKLGHCLWTFCGALNVLFYENNTTVNIEIILLIYKLSVFVNFVLKVHSVHHCGFEC